MPASDHFGAVNYRIADTGFDIRNLLPVQTD
jgi:hypothetical protein